MSITDEYLVNPDIAVGTKSKHAGDAAQLEKNKRTVIEFYNKFLNEKDIDAAVALMGPTYTQHNAFTPDGKDGFKQFFTGFFKEYPQYRTKIVRAIAEGDYVFLHAHAIRKPGERGEAVMDLFRMEDGKLIEHWDVLQDVPEEIPHQNTMF